MAKKKTTIANKKTAKAKKDAKVNELDNVLEDMKKLALEAPTNDIEEVEKAVQENINDNVEDVVSIEIDEDINLENTTEDLSFIDEIKDNETETNEEEEIKEETENLKEEKPKKSKMRTYQEMFGGTWRGYGYDEF